MTTVPQTLEHLSDAELREAITHATSDGAELQPALQSEAIRRYIAQGAAAPSPWRDRLTLTWAATLVAAATSGQPGTLEEAAGQVSLILDELEAAGGIGPTGGAGHH